MSDRSAFHPSRRTFVKAGVATAALVGLAGLNPGRTLRAEGLPQLEEGNPQAQALKYVHDASTVVAADRGGEGNVCETCRFYTGEPSAEWGPCSLFPGKGVKASGWCAGFVAKQS